MLGLRGHLRHFLGLALLLSLMAGTTRAELITMTLTDSSGSFSVDIFATPGATTYNVDSFGLFEINSVLAAQGSEYQFFSLGGSSNFPGNTIQGNLVITGEVHSVVGGGSDSFLQITESESGFTSPTGTSGTLMSASTGDFTNELAGVGHSAQSLFNSTATPVYSVFSSGVIVNPEGNNGNATIIPVSAPYTLTNTVTFDLSPAGTNDVIDSFGVTATVTANGVVPEPTSLVMLLMGAGAPLVVVGITRRSCRASASR
jgi:hypothetical protein